VKELATSYKATDQEDKATGILRIGVALLEEYYFGEDHVFILEVIERCYPGRTRYHEGLDRP